MHRFGLLALGCIVIAFPVLAATEPRDPLAFDVKAYTEAHVTIDGQPKVIRHGLLDRDTAFALQVTLAAAVRNNPAVKAVNFKLAWMQGHAGNYDVQEAYAWLAETLAHP